MQRQEKYVRDLTSTNLKITIEEIKKLQKVVKTLRKEISHLRSGPEFTENVLEEKVQRPEEKYGNLKNRFQELYESQLDPDYICNKLVDLEERSRQSLTKYLRQSLVFM